MAISIRVRGRRTLLMIGLARVTTTTPSSVRLLLMVHRTILIKEISDQLHSNSQAQTTVMARTDIAVGGKIAGAGDSLPGRPGMADNMTYREEIAEISEYFKFTRNLTSQEDDDRDYQMSAKGRFGYSLRLWRHDDRKENSRKRRELPRKRISERTNENIIK